MKNLVRQYREAKNLTQYQLAKKVGLTRRGILTLEKGASAPRLDNAVRIAKVLDVDLDVLFCVDEYLATLNISKEHSCNPARYKNGDYSNSGE